MRAPKSKVTITNNGLTDPDILGKYLEGHLINNRSEEDNAYLINHNTIDEVENTRATGMCTSMMSLR
ncbi:hypothetical protein [Pontibacter rugosus]|uniref:Uncharacterized protein n=1 Tax=Pontibacter rugosus TaxID=1745966 RepID=A0ABW3SMQ7_9BACT